MKDINSTEKTKIQHSARKSGGVPTIIGKRLQLFSTPARTRTRNTQTSGSYQNPPTPQMNVFKRIALTLKWIILVNWYFWIIKQLLLKCLGTNQQLLPQTQTHHKITHQHPGAYIHYEKNKSWICF